MARSLLQRCEDVVLVADGRDHDNARLGMLADDPLDSFDALHLWQGDVHQDNVRVCARVLGNRCAAVASFACNLAAKCVNHLCQALAREDGVVYYKIADGLAILLSSQWRKWFHDFVSSSPILTFHSPILVRSALLPTAEAWSMA